MDECFDSGIDSDFSDSLDIDIEPVVDIPIEEPAMENFDDFEPSESESELTELQNEAEALEIEPFEEVEYDFYEGQTTDWQQDNDNSGSHSVGTRLLAGALAPVVALDPMAAQIENLTANNVPNEVPAIHAETDYVPQTPEQIMEQYQQGGWEISDEKNDKNVSNNS